MKVMWNRLMARLDALSLRERVLLFGGVIAVFAVLTDWLFVTPLTQQQRMLTQSIDLQSEDSEARRDQLLATLQKRDRERVVSINSDLGKLQSEIDVLDRDIAGMSSASVDTTALPALLDRVLKKTDRVSVVKVASLKGELPSAAALAGNPSVAATPARPALDITLSGGYLDLMEYLVNLEKALPWVRWSALKMSTESSPPQVTVRMLLPGEGS